MRILLTSLNFILISVLCIAQGPDAKSFGEFNVSSAITIDNVRNFSGGIEKGSSTLALLNLNFDYSFKKGLLKNTRFYGHFQKTAGKGTSEHFIGDIQVASNIEGRDVRFFYELYVQQKLGDFTILAGIHDLNSEFIMSDFAGDFINSSFGIFPSISLNIPVSIFPSTTFGGIVSYDKKKVSVLAGLYNMNYDFVEEETFEFENHFYQDGYFGIGEVRYRWFKNNSLRGEYKFGGYLQHCNNHKDNNNEECLSENNYGFYFIADQVLKEFTSGRLIGAFLQLGIAPRQKNFASNYYAAGISMREIAKNWLPDQLGLAFGWVKLNKLEQDTYQDVNKYEAVMEFTAQKRLLKSFIIQPDIQYVVKPSGLYSNSITGMVRLIVELN